ncbi:MAG: hypothetical protein OEW19_09315, partial [Acidobacteriota bacterium]|nr:hypothetical protein [Acidobacteriota bacterium]
TNTPRSTEDIERIQRLVSAAVGLDPSRGDQLTVENIPFGEQAPSDEAPTGGGTWLDVPQQIAPYAPQIVRVVSVLTIALLAVLMVLRPMMRAAFPAQRLQAAGVGDTLVQSPRTVAEMEGAIEAQLDASLGPAGEARRLPLLAKRIAKRAEEKPEDLARLVRTWLSEEER